jgi:hypothetical protein
MTQRFITARWLTAIGLALASLFVACGDDKVPNPSSSPSSGSPATRFTCDEDAFGQLAGPDTYEQAVIVYIPLSGDSGTEDELARLLDLECELAFEVKAAEAGAYEGNEIGGGRFTIYLYGEDADRLAGLTVDVLRRWEIPADSYLIKRYGDLLTDPSPREERIDLSPSP